MYFSFAVDISGRVHSAMISGINKELNSVMVEWYENGEAKGKEVSFCNYSYSSYMTYIEFYSFIQSFMCIL